MSTGMCLECKDIIQSKEIHDFVRCGCGKSFLDGGDEYIRAGGSLLIMDEPGMTAEEFMKKLEEMASSS